MTPLLYQFRYKEQNTHCVDYGQWGEWETCPVHKWVEINEYIDRGYWYETRELGAIRKKPVSDRIVV